MLTDHFIKSFIQKQGVKGKAQDKSDPDAGDAKMEHKGE